MLLLNMRDKKDLSVTNALIQLHLSQISFATELIFMKMSYDLNALYAHTSVLNKVTSRGIFYVSTKVKNLLRVKYVVFVQTKKQVSENTSLQFMNRRETIHVIFVLIDVPKLKL